MPHAKRHRGGHQFAPALVAVLAGSGAEPTLAAPGEASAPSPPRRIHRAPPPRLEGRDRVLLLADVAQLVDPVQQAVPGEWVDR